MIRKSTLIAGAMALALGILLSPAAVMAHGHGGGHHNNNHDHDDNDYNYDSDGFWSGPEVNEVVTFGGSDANADPCTNLNDRLNYPGLCPDDD
jgi:hypothetical protein